MAKATRRNSNKTKLVAIVTKTKIIFMKRIPKNAIKKVRLLSKEINWIERMPRNTPPKILLSK
ncbi:hypothetical protein [Streptococcus mitis]|uniref:hypothetical protein n=1 Tax=Streptococcus mitis TaxID=28037 RepID=UPI00159D1E5E|nr:hypothetical protein [Streptococcus mitis]MDU6550400.1 hypothetical protein [Streptococcus mitis]